MERPIVHITLYEGSWIASLAAKKLKTKQGLAIVFFRTIYLHDLKAEDLLQNTRMFRHEVKHILQYQEHGWFMFLIKYLWYCVRFGYYNNPLEREARAAEDDPSIVTGIEVMQIKRSRK